MKDSLFRILEAIEAIQEPIMNLAMICLSLVIVVCSICGVVYVVMSLFGVTD